MLDRVLSELAEAPRDDRKLAELAVSRLYRAMRLRKPNMHWVKSIRAGAELAQVLTADDDNSASTARRPFRRSFWRLDLAFQQIVGIEIPSDFMELEAESLQGPPPFRAATLESHDVARSLSRASLSPKELHFRLMSGVRVDESLESCLHPGLVPLHEGPFEARSLMRVARYEAVRRSRGIRISPAQDRFLDALMDLARNTYWVFLAGTDAVISLPPIETHYDSEGRPHCETGPAIVTGEGQSIHALRGIWANRDTIFHPERLQVRDIEIEPDWDTRSLMIEQYGLERYLRDSHAIKWHEDEYGELFWKAQHQQDPLVAVRVRNSTPEPDGSVQHYVLRVPPHISTAREAVAWTFGMEEEEYAPILET